MAKPRKKHNPDKLKNKVQNFVYEIRVWNETTDEGPIEQSNAFAFPVENIRLKADKYAFDFGIVAWAFLTAGMTEAEQLETVDRVKAILDDDGIAALEELKAKMVPPCYGQLVRHPTKISFGTRMAAYCTVQDGRFRVTDAIAAADNTIGRLAS